MDEEVGYFFAAFSIMLAEIIGFTVGLLFFW